MNKYGTNWGSQTCRFCPLPFHTGVIISNSQCVKKCEQLLQEWITGSNGDRPINEIGKPLRRHINFHNDEKQREEKKMKELIEEQISIAQRGSRLPMCGPSLLQTSAFDTTFRAVIQSFFDEPESFNPHKDFEIFFNAFRAKKKLSLEEIDYELWNIMELSEIRVGLNNAIFDFLDKNAEMEVKKRPAERLIVLSKTMDGYKRWKPVKGKGGRYRQPL